MVWSVTRAIGASDHGVWYGHSVLCLTVSRLLSPRQAVSPTPYMSRLGALGMSGPHSSPPSVTYIPLSDPMRAGAAREHLIYVWLDYAMIGSLSRRCHLW